MIFYHVRQGKSDRKVDKRHLKSSYGLIWLEYFKKQSYKYYIYQLHWLDW